MSCTLLSSSKSAFVDFCFISLLCVRVCHSGDVGLLLQVIVALDSVVSEQTFVVRCRVCGVSCELKGIIDEEEETEPLMDLV